MDKSDALDLIIKAFGIFLLVKAVQAIPQMISGIMIFCVVGFGGIKSLLTDTELTKTINAMMLSQGIDSLAKFVIYLVISISFLRSATWIKKIIGNKEN